jgi:protocatechuate 3,4-dioxygenase beta subunit
MPNDHRISDRLTRRDALVAAGLLGAAGGVWSLLRSGGDTAEAGATARSAAARCVLAPELTEGPYYIDEHLFRRNITEGKPGTPLDLRLTVEDATTCEPIHNATVEVWHCDAQGDYSGYDAAAGAAPAPGGGGPPGGGGGHATPTSTTTYLRGAQRTGRTGLVAFRTIYPGWYQGRTTHIHLKVHVGGKEVHTGQLFFKDSLNAAVYAAGAYAAHGRPDTTNASDSIYANGGSRSLPAMRRKGSGYVGAITLGVKT